MSVKYQEIRSGLGSTIDTVKAMIDESVNGSIDWDIIEKTRSIVCASKIDTKDEKKIADKIFGWIKKNIKFIRDPYYAELIQSPKKTLLGGSGDCDELSITFAAMNLAIGNNVRFITIAGQTIEGFDHVYVEVKCKDKWIPYDLAVNGSYPGWEPPKYYYKAIWQINGDVEFLDGFFDDIVEKIKDEADRLIDRIKNEVKRVSRKIREEKRRVFQKVSEEFARWEEKHGMGGQFMVLGVKVLVMGVLPGTSIALQVSKNPFKLSKEEWKLFGKIATTVGSAILSLASAGSSSYLLAQSVMDLTSTALTIVDVRDSIKERKDLVKKLKAQKAKYAEEVRVKREAIRKLQFDIAALEEIEKQIESNKINIKNKQEENNKKLIEHKKNKTKYAKEKINKFYNEKYMQYVEYNKQLKNQEMGINKEEFSSLLQEMKMNQKNMINSLTKLRKIMNIIKMAAK